MHKRLILIAACSIIVLPSAFAKDKNKSSLPDSVLEAQTVRVVVSPDAGQSINQPTANAAARDRVENAFAGVGQIQTRVRGGI